MTVSCLVHSGLQCLYLVYSLHVYRLFTVTGISLVCSVVSLEFPLEVFTILQILLPWSSDWHTLHHDSVSLACPVNSVLARVVAHHHLVGMAIMIFIVLLSTTLD